MSDSAKRLAWWTVAVCVIFNIFSLLDRNIVAVLLPDMKADLGLNSFEIAIVQGVGFALFYSTAGLFLGYMVDRFSRRWLMWGALTLWSLAAAATGLASNPLEMFLARMMVGVGEAAVAPAAHSLISASFPRDRLATPMAVYVSSGVLGIGLSYAIGGYLLTSFGQHPLSILGIETPWRQVLLAVGLPGILFAFLAFSLRESRPSAVVSDREIARWSLVFSFLAENRRLTCGLMFGFMMTSCASTSVGFWAPSYARIVLGSSPDQVGRLLSFVIGGGGLVGGITIGLTSDWLMRRGVLDAPLRCFFWAALLGVPAALIAFVADDPLIFYAGVLIFQLSLASTFAPILAAVQVISPVMMRGRMAALIMLLSTLGAFALGPTLTGALISFAFGEKLIGLAVAVTIALSGAAAALCYWAARPSYLTFVGGGAKSRAPTNHDRMPRKDDELVNL